MSTNRISADFLGLVGLGLPGLRACGKWADVLGYAQFLDSTALDRLDMSPGVCDMLRPGRSGAPGFETGHQTPCLPSGYSLAKNCCCQGPICLYRPRLLGAGRKTGLP